MLMEMCIPKFSIYQVAVASNCFKSPKTLDFLTCFKNKFCLMSGLKFTLSNDLTLFLPGLKKILWHLSGLKKNYIHACMAASAYHVTLKGVENHVFRHNLTFRHTCMYKQSILRKQWVIMILCKYYIDMSDTLIDSWIRFSYWLLYYQSKVSFIFSVKYLSSNIDPSNDCFAYSFHH